MNQKVIPQAVLHQTALHQMSIHQRMIYQITITVIKKAWMTIQLVKQRMKMELQGYLQAVERCPLVGYSYYHYY